MQEKRNNRNVSIEREQSELACFAEREKRRMCFNLRSVLLLFLLEYVSGVVAWVIDEKHHWPSRVLPPAGTECGLAWNGTDAASLASNTCGPW